MTKVKSVKTNDIKKGTPIITKQLGGRQVSGTMEDNLRGNTRFIHTKGSEIGLFDEMGSVYAWDIVSAKVDGIFVPVELTDKQIKDRDRITRLNTDLFGGF